MPINPYNLTPTTLKGQLPEAVGDVVFVSSATGNVSGDGSSLRPFSTIEAAFNKSGLSAGDVIVVLPGHTETISAAAGIVADVAGVTVIGMGNGSNRPTITLDTATTADIDIDAANITIKNLRFVSNIDSLAVVLDVNAGNFVCEDCEFVSSSTKEIVNFVNLATTIDGFTFRRCKFIQPTDPAGTDGAAATGCFYLVDSEDLFIEDCYFYGNFESAIVHNKTTAAKNVWLRNCYGTQLLSGAEVFIQVAAMEGGAQNCFFIIPGADDVTEAKTWGTMSDKFFIDVNSSIGNDGAGGQLGVAGATAAS